MTEERRYQVGFTANLYVEVLAKSEDEARTKATDIAEWTSDHFDMDAAQTAGSGEPRVSMVIHPDDMVTIQAEAEDDRLARELRELDAKYHDHLPEGANCPGCGIDHAAINPQNLNR